MPSMEPFPTSIPPLDETAYSREVLNGELEDNLDTKLSQEAIELGLDLQLPAVRAITSSMSVTTVSSDPPAQRLSRSTGPTSCSSSDHRPITQSSDISPPLSPSIQSEPPEKKHRLSFRGIRKMAGFKKRSSGSMENGPSIFQPTGRSPAYKQNGNSTNTMNSPVSPHSRDLTLPWCSQSPFHSVSQLFPDEDMGTVKAWDKDAIRRTKECHEMQILLRRQLVERDNFLDFQRRSIKRLRGQQASAKQALQEEHSDHVQTMHEHNEILTDELEHRQLQAEMDLRSELDAKKQACLIRLRHMEAYCHSPSTPATPETSPISSRGARNSTASVTSQDESSASFYSRRVTDKDYQNLEAQYRERDAMDSLHQSKIEVLRGKQERQLRQFTAKKQREVNEITSANDRAEKTLEWESQRDLDSLQQALEDKRIRIEWRWRLANTVEVAKMEAKTGNTFALPEDLKVQASGYG